MELSVEALKTFYRQHAQDYSDVLRLRLHRGLSWLAAAQEKKDDLDICFICLWICFNAVYADDFDVLNDKQSSMKFLTQVCGLDAKKQLYSLVWETFSNTIRVLLDNEFAFQPFWDDYTDVYRQNTQEWKEVFSREKRIVKRAMEEQNTERILNIVFKRLYTVRNQIFHGSATYNSSANKSQKQDACTILLRILPVIIEIIMLHPEEDWGMPYYPLIKER